MYAEDDGEENRTEDNKDHGKEHDTDKVDPNNVSNKIDVTALLPKPIFEKNDLHETQQEHEQEQDQEEQRQDDDDGREEGWKGYRHAFSLTWTDYKSTWKGFFDNHGQSNRSNQHKNNDNNNDNNILSDVVLPSLQNASENLSINISRNKESLKETSSDLLSLAKEQTGLRNKADVKQFTLNQIRLATECVGEFMKGYRKGRDSESERVLNEYWKGLEEEGSEILSNSEKIEKEEDMTTKDESNDDENSDTKIKGSTTAGRKRKKRKYRKDSLY